MCGSGGDQNLEVLGPDDAVFELDPRGNHSESAAEPSVRTAKEFKALVSFFADSSVGHLIYRHHMEGVFHDDLVVAPACGAFALPVSPAAPTRHQALGILPVAFAHLDGMDVGEQALGAPAKEVLLELDERGGAEDGGGQQRGNRDGDRFAEIADAHGWVDTGSCGSVPGSVKAAVKWGRNPVFSTKGRRMQKKTINPFSRGMGAPEDFVTEPFVPSEQFKATQREMMERLIASGLDPEEVESRSHSGPGFSRG